MNLPERPITILIAALGGEGGGVMADWLMEAATHCGLPAQATSIPGVAQRTGATTYYLEIYPVTRDVLGVKEPVLSLTPSPGNVDVMVASELVEAGRAMQNGSVTASMRRSRRCRWPMAVSTASASARPRKRSRARRCSSTCASWRRTAAR
jgi:hypothetical protein